MLGGPWSSVKGNLPDALDRHRAEGFKVHGTEGLDIDSSFGIEGELDRKSVV